MKNSSLIVLSIVGFILIGCQQKTSVKNTTQNPLTNCSPPSVADKTCANYCTFYPCTTGGSTSGATTGGNTGGSSPNRPYPTISDFDRGNLYSGYAVPAKNCSATSNDPYLNPTKFATITMSGGHGYRPNKNWTLGNPQTSNYAHNISPWMTNINEALRFVQTDSRLLVRVIPRPQPDPAGGLDDPWCYGRVTYGSPHKYGYTKMKLNLALEPLQNVARNSQGDIISYTLGTPVFSKSVEVSLTNCSETMDFSNWCSGSQYPDGCVLTVNYVTVNQDCSNVWDGSGKVICNSFKPVQDHACWALDLEVSTNSTQSF